MDKNNVTAASQVEAAAPQQSDAEIVEAVRAAMKRAYNLGQTYWAQADSMYLSQNKKADVTAGRFIELTDDICAKIAAKAAQDAPSAPTGVVVPRATLLMIYEAMNYMGDILNGMDACEEEDEEATTPAFDAMRELLDNSYQAAPAPTEAPALAEKVAAVRRDALEEAAQIAETCYAKSAISFELGTEAASRIRALKEAAPAEVPSQQGGEA